MARVFISYRRNDSQHQADRLYEALTRVLPKADVFIDIDNIPAGVDFAKHISTYISKSDIMLVLIGPAWLAPAAATGTPRILEPGDYVRLEIASALRANLMVVPVLLDGAAMPAAEALPDDLRALTGRNAVSIARPTFERDVEALVQRLGLRRPGARLAPWLGAAAVALIALGLVWFGANQTPPSSSVDAPATEAPAVSASPQPPTVAANAAPTAPATIPLDAPLKPTAAPPQNLPAPAQPARAENCAECPPLQQRATLNGRPVVASAPITFADLAPFCAAAPCGEDAARRDPSDRVTSVTWSFANQYALWLSTKSGRRVRLASKDELSALQQSAQLSGAYSDWSSTCQTPESAKCAAYYVVGRDAKGADTLDWHSPNARGATLGLRVVADE
jgi:hypothetical protein